MGWIIGLIRISKDKESIWNTNRFERNSVCLWDILDFFFIASISWETFHSLCKWLNVLRLMIFFQVILGSFDLSCSQVLLKEIMSVISMRNYKPLLIFTNNTVSCKTMIMFFTVVVMLHSIMVMIFMVGILTSLVTVLVMMMILLSWMLYWFTWIFQRCWLPTVAI